MKPPSPLPSLSDLRTALAGPLPGAAAQLEMAPIPRPGGSRTYQEAATCSLKAGVLLLLYPKDGETHIVFIRRPSFALHHKDQIAFPGGQFEAGEDAAQAALREAHEEVGVPPETIETAGTLTPLYVPPSNFCIYPVVGRTEKTPAFRPSEPEVAEIIEAPLARLLDPATVQKGTWALDRGPVLVPFYDCGGHRIWGATAMILAEFLAVLRGVAFAADSY
jgi:8-oxo-dGTP pyrophosphatase MutT (NUDIX family)